MMDTLGDHMKQLEGVESARRLTYPICIRLDGRAFSAFTRDLERPYDVRLSSMMYDLTCALVAETGARVGYTQSDEISLVLLQPNEDSDGYFGLRAQKIASMTAAFASSWFARNLDARIPEKAGQSPLFDSRAWSVPTIADAAATLLWRELDARKNSYTMAASTCFHHKELLNKTSEEKREMLRSVGVDFDAYPEHFRRGAFVTRVEVEVERKYTPEEAEQLPPKHHGRNGGTLRYVRNELRPFHPKPLHDMSTPERVEALFGIVPENVT